MLNSILESQIVEEQIQDSREMASDSVSFATFKGSAQNRSGNEFLDENTGRLRPSELFLMDHADPNIS